MTASAILRCLSLVGHSDYSNVDVLPATHTELLTAMCLTLNYLNPEISDPVGGTLPTVVDDPCRIVAACIAGFVRDIPLLVTALRHIVGSQCLAEYTLALLSTSVPRL